MNRLMQEDEMRMLLKDERLAAGVHVLNVVSAWPSIAVLNIMLKGGAKRASEVSAETRLGMRDVLNTLNDLESVGLVRCRYDERQRVKYWDVVSRRFKVVLEADEAGIKVTYGSEGESKGFLAKMRSTFEQRFGSNVKE